MYYAHTGDSSDNAFTTFNGVPTRTFLAFETKKERQDAQDKIWAESNKSQNLILLLLCSIYVITYFASPNN